MCSALYSFRGGEVLVEELGRGFEEVVGGDDAD
jgi:hypothetical protein